MNIAVSACLLGCPCRYDHKSCTSGAALSLAQKHVLIPVCPETMGGLDSPRDPIELCHGRPLTASGNDLSEALQNGCGKAMEAVRQLDAQAALLMQRSPSCGCGKIYDGTFSSTLIEGDGLFTQALKQHGIPVFSIEELEADPILFEKSGFDLSQKDGSDRN